MSHKWAENRQIGLCHSCSRAIEDGRLALGRTRCLACARRAAAAEKLRRNRDESARLMAESARLMAELAELAVRVEATLAKSREIVTASARLRR